MTVMAAFAARGTALADEAEVPGRWPAEKAWAWYNRQPWLVGCNFLPSTAVNDVEMWQDGTFDPETIDRELGWAQDLGFNTMRVFMNCAVWEADAAAFKRNLKRFLDLAEKHEAVALVILFDDCFKPEPRVGKQDEPEPGVHNSQWVQSPGVRRRGDRAAWPKLEQYVKDVVGTFASDKRVLAWELYNEPTASQPLMEAAFRWAREAGPSQPVTATVYGNTEMRRRVMELSDILCFHNYGPLPGLQADVAGLLAHGRPVLCTEWMARGNGSRFETHLPFFKEKNIACWNWGLVAGRTQTYFPWGSPKGAPEPALWHHDILRKDGTPFAPAEIRSIKRVTDKPRLVTLMPTAERAPVAWRYTEQKPAADWFKTGFDASAWKQGDAPFGVEEPAFSRHPRTAWKSADIWLLRVCDWNGGALDEGALNLYHDDDAEVFIDGVQVAKAAGYTACYERCCFQPEDKVLLSPGRHAVAVHIRQTKGGQYFDLGIDGVLSRREK